MEASGTEEGSRPRRANELGPTGNQLGENVKKLREEVGLTTEQLAERVTQLGRPMRGTTITKIEKKQRRVDADDLMALALALGVNVSALLLPETAEGTAEVTGLDHAVNAFRLWSWASGDVSLPLADDPSWEGPTDRLTPAQVDQRTLFWWRHCKPHRQMARPADWARNRTQLNAVLSAAQDAVDAGVSLPLIIDLLQEAVTEPAMFETVDGTERVVANVGSFEFNRMMSSPNWRRLPAEAASAYRGQRQTDEGGSDADGEHREAPER